MNDKIIKALKNTKVKAVAYWSKMDLRMRAVFVLFWLTVLSLTVFWTLTFINRNDEVVFEIIKDNTKAEQDIPADYIRRGIDGVYVPAGEANYYPIAVMIDNDPAARPQAGLAEANIVYEAKAESGVTRLMAIYAAGRELDAVGPIRSARPYFIDWAEGYDALYAHIGGSPEALEMLKKTKMLNLNEFYQGQYFWRSDKKNMPHNVYSMSANFNMYLEKLNAENHGYEMWKYKDAETRFIASSEENAPENITIDFSVNDFLVNWKYDVENNSYIRYMGGKQHTDADGAEIIAKNIIILKVNADVIDKLLRRKMYHIGSGKAWYCFGGKCQAGEWKKPDKKIREKIYDKDGQEALFNAGTAWIEVIQYEEELNITASN